MDIGIVVYHHRHGVDVYPVILKDIDRETVNERINDAFMKAIGVNDTELDDPAGEESAWLYGPSKLDEIPIVGPYTGQNIHPFDWMPSD